MAEGSGVAPFRSYNNDYCCVEERITKTRNGLETWPLAWQVYRDEFIELLIPDSLVHTGVPQTIQEVMEEQSRPTQRAGALAAQPFAFCYRFLIKAFQKAECYAKLAAPRNIATTDADHRTRYGGFTRTFCEHIFKQQPWYAFSKTPEEIAHEVRRVAAGAEFIVPTDYSVWDGTHSEPLAQSELTAAKRFFHPTYHLELEKLLMDQYNAPGFTKFEIRYNTRWARSSGSSDTSLFNTFDNALVMYICLRDSGLGAKAAWDGLGLFGGDDGIQGNIPPGLLTRTTKRMGHKIKLAVVKKHQPVPFLGRIFVDPWAYLWSIADTLRQVRKLHLSTSPADVPNYVALYQKCLGIITTDPTTPILSAYARSAIRIIEEGRTTTALVGLMKKHEVALKNDQKWFAQFDGPFPVPPADNPEMWAIVAEQFGETVTHMLIQHEALESAEDLSTFPVRVFTAPLATAVACEYQGEVRTPPESQDQNMCDGKSPQPSDNFVDGQPSGSGGPSGSSDPAGTQASHGAPEPNQRVQNPVAGPGTNPGPNGANAPRIPALANAAQPLSTGANGRAAVGTVPTVPAVQPSPVPNSGERNSGADRSNGVRPAGTSGRSVAGMGPRGARGGYAARQQRGRGRGRGRGGPANRR
jgi:hypothetical protein